MKKYKPFCLIYVAFLVLWVLILGGGAARRAAESRLQRDLQAQADRLFGAVTLEYRGETLRLQPEVQRPELTWGQILRPADMSYHPIEISLTVSGQYSDQLRPGGVPVYSYTTWHERTKGLYLSTWMTPWTHDTIHQNDWLSDLFFRIAGYQARRRGDGRAVSVWEQSVMRHMLPSGSYVTECVYAASSGRFTCRIEEQGDVDKWMEGTGSFRAVLHIAEEAHP